MGFLETLDGQWIVSGIIARSRSWSEFAHRRGSNEIENRMGPLRLTPTAWMGLRELHTASQRQFEDGAIYRPLRPAERDSNPRFPTLSVWMK